MSPENTRSYLLEMLYIIEVMKDAIEELNPMADLSHISQPIIDVRAEIKYIEP